MFAMLALVFGVAFGFGVPAFAEDSQGGLSEETYRAYSVGDEYKYPLVVNTSTDESKLDDGDELLVYCFNAQKDFPAPYPGNVYRELKNATDEQFDSYADPLINGHVERRAVLNAVYNGYPFDASGLKDKYGLTDSQFRCVTQAAVWYFTEGPAFLKKEYQAYSGEVGSELTTVSLAQAYLAWNGDGSNYFPWTAQMDGALEELTTGLDGLTDASDDLELNLLISKEDSIQNLLFVRHKPVVTFEVTKSLLGGELKDGQFEFVLKDEEGATVATATNDASGKVTFESQKFANPGTYKLTIQENEGADPAIDYDNHVVTATVEVIGDEVDSGAVLGNIKVTYEGDTSFKNYCTVDISGTKTWNDNNNERGDRPESVTVDLLANGTVVESKVIDASSGWAYEFKGLHKTDEQGEEITYTVAEHAVQGYTTTYDGYNIINTPIPSSPDDDDKPVAKKSKDALPKTGDDANKRIYLSLGAASLVAVAASLVLRKKRTGE